VDAEDVRLAVQMYAEQNVTSPPGRETLLELARARNSAPLPTPRASSGLRLPPDRHCLTACNYRVKYRPKPRPPGVSGAVLAGQGPAPTFQMMVPRPPITAVGQAAPKAVFKMQPQPSFSFSPQVDAGGQHPVFKLTVNPTALPSAGATAAAAMTSAGQGVKRKADEVEGGL